MSGLSLILRKAPPTLYESKQISSILQLLSNASTTPFIDKDNKADINMCKDNVIAVLGSLIKSYANKFPEIINNTVRAHWLNQLPLLHDIIEGNTQQELLIDILSQDPGILVQDSNDLVRICQIYATYVIKRNIKMYQELIQKTKHSLLTIKDWSLFQQSSEYIWNNLTNSQRNALTYLLKND